MKWIVKNKHYQNNEMGFIQLKHEYFSSCQYYGTMSFIQYKHQDAYDALE